MEAGGQIHANQNALGLFRIAVHGEHRRPSGGRFWLPLPCAGRPGAFHWLDYSLTKGCIPYSEQREQVMPASW